MYVCMYVCMTYLENLTLIIWTSNQYYIYIYKRSVFSSNQINQLVLI